MKNLFRSLAVLTVLLFTVIPAKANCDEPPLWENGKVRVGVSINYEGRDPIQTLVSFRGEGTLVSHWFQGKGYYDTFAYITPTWGELINVYCSDPRTIGPDIYFTIPIGEEGGHITVDVDYNGIYWIYFDGYASDGAWFEWRRDY